jgi:hypothetical protein
MRAMKAVNTAETQKAVTESKKTGTSAKRKKGSRTSSGL